MIPGCVTFARRKKRSISPLKPAMQQPKTSILLPMKLTHFHTLAVSAVLAAPTFATTLVIDANNSTFGRVGGVVVTFGSDAPDKNWSAGVPQNGTSYPILSVGFTKNNNNATFESLWLGIYDSVTDITLGNFLGASTASVAWGAGQAGDQFTWTFDNVDLTANDGQQLVFAFQDDNQPRANYLVGAENPEGAIGLRRMDNNGLLANEGAAILHGSGAGIVSNRVPHIILNVIPEPGSALLGLFGLLGCMRRRR